MAESAFKADMLAGKIAFVPGASSSIDPGVAKGLAEAGASVALISRSADKIEGTTQVQKLVITKNMLREFTII